MNDATKGASGAGAPRALRAASLAYAKQKSKALGLEVRASKTGNAKIDVLRDGSVIARVGDRRYRDYAQYKELEARGEVPRGTADERRRLYHARHGQSARKRDGQYTRGFLAGELLW